MSTPAGYHTVTPYLTVDKAEPIIHFLIQAFGAEEVLRMAKPDGGIAHAEVRIGDSMVMLGESPNPVPSMLYLYLADTDAVYERALKAGAVSVLAPCDKHYGDRTAAVKDAAGNQWYMATRKQELTPEKAQVQPR